MAQPAPGPKPNGSPGYPTSARPQVIQRIKVYNHGQQMYINDEDDDPVPPGYTKVSKYFHNVYGPGWTTQPSPLLPPTPLAFPQLPEIPLDEFDETMANLRDVGFYEWNTPVATLGGISTEEMGSCTTIGFTGFCFTEGRRQEYSALYHNVDPDGDPQSIGGIIANLQGLFDGTNLPKFSDLAGVRHFAMGGHSTSTTTCQSIEQVFRQANLTVIGVTFKAHPGDDDLVKAVLVDSSGNVKYATFRREKKKEESVFDVSFGFSSSKDFYKRDDRDKGGPGGFGGFGGGFMTASSVKTTSQ